MSTRKLTIKEMQDIAESRDGKCLSEKYVNMRTKLTWECNKCHRWDTTPHSIKTLKTWCPYCAKNISGIKEMKEFANSRGGKCLSDEYINTYTKLTWQCDKGHVWQATPNNITSGKSWCPVCNIIKRNKFP